jgi:peptidoglycan/xylan/chitin deacetylase (PgdA/CDA1 family)
VTPDSDLQNAEASEMSAASRIFRLAAAHFWRASGRIERNRQALYGGAKGLRIVTFHATPPATLDHLKRLVDWWSERRPMGSPEDVDEIVAGRWQAGAQDRLLITFDDGLGSNHDAAVWLAYAGIRATFFIVPSFVDRTIAQFVRFHEERGVKAFPPVPDRDVPGLSTSQVREMLSMGHRIGAHNYAHRDLGKLHGPAELRDEIGNAIDTVGDLIGAPCRDFAIGFGQPENVSTEAANYLRNNCPRVYLCHRGLNVPGMTPRFLLRHARNPGHPLVFTQVCLEGGADHRLADRMRLMGRRVGLLPRILADGGS